MKTQYQFYLLKVLFLMSFLCSFRVNAQKIVIDTKERDAWFYYEAFEYRDKPLVLLVSSYIFRNKLSDSNNQYTQRDSERIKLIIRNGFSDRTNNIVTHHGHSGAVSVDKVSGSNGVQEGWSYKGYVSVSGYPRPKNYNIYDNTTAYLVAAREELIQRYIDDGYKVYQFDFEEYYERELVDRNYKENVEKIQKISSTWIPTYRDGDFDKIYNQAVEKSKSGTTRKKSNNNKTTESKTTEVPYCTTQKWRVENSIARAESLNTREAWLEAQATYEDAYSKCGTSLQNYLYFKSAIEKGLTDVAILNIAAEMDDATGKNEYEFYMGENKEKDGSSGLLQFGILWKLIFGHSQPYIRPYVGAGVTFTTLPSYTLRYEDEAGNRPAGLPSHNSHLFLNNMTHLTATLGLNGEIPLDRSNYPYNSFNLAWDIGGTAGYSISDPSEELDFTLSSYDFVPDFLIGTKGSLTLELYFSDNFGIGLMGGVNYLFLKKEFDNSVIHASGNYAIKGEYQAPLLNTFFGFKLIFRK